MIKIIKGPMTIERKTNDISACNPLNDSIHFKFDDGTELILLVKMTQTLKAILETMERINSGSFELNLNDSKTPLRITG